MDRGLAGHVALAAAATALAAVAWIRPELGRGGVDAAAVVVAADAGSLQEVRWEGENNAVRVSYGEHGLQVTTQRQPAPPDTGGAPAAAAAAAVTFPGSAQADELMASMAPLVAARRLGKLAPARREAVGLAAPAAHLTLQVRGVAHALAIGHAAFGTRDEFCEAEDGTAYLLRAGTLATLRHGAVALQDHAAVGLARDAFDRVEVAFDGAHRSLVQRHGEAGAGGGGAAAAAAAAYFFADPADPTHPLGQLTAWMDRLLALSVVEVLPTPPQPPPEPRLAVRFFAEDVEVGAVAVWPSRPAAPSAGTSHRFAAPVAFYRATVEALLGDAAAALAEKR